MQTSFNDIMKKYKIDTSRKFYDKTIHQNKLVEELNGYWFELESKWNGFANLFIADNEINENLEVYINIFIKDMDLISKLTIDSLFLNIKNEWLYLQKTINIEYVYIQVIFENQTKTVPESIINEVFEFSLLSYIVKKDTLNGSNEQNSILKNLIIDQASHEDEGEILNCLINAYINGTDPNIYSKIGKEKFQSNIKKYYTPLITNEKLILVSKFNGDFCGHVTFDLDPNNLLTGNNAASLIDVYVLNEFNGLGISNKLISAGEKECVSLGIDTLFGNVNVEGNYNKAHKILDSLFHQGWTLESIVFGRNL